MSSPQSQTSSQPSEDSLLGNARAFLSLVPRQINDEISLAKQELKTKGVKVGVAAAMFVTALLILSLLVTALVVAAIMGLATVMPAWLAALIVAAFFLVLIGIAVFLGLRIFKKALPLVPEDAIRGLKHDLGILREGNGFDPQTLVKPELSKEEKEALKAEKLAKAEEAKAEREAKQAEADPVPSEAELRERLTLRRQHLLGLRESLLERMDVKKQTQRLLDDPNSAIGQARRNWLPWSVAAVSATTFFVLLRRLFRK
ncbi:phage holin family protein [Psychromicrobium sp. YIM B11713]|uniref:phage holin family protein n=1 Tax=Psychromicrobium sp. YIM B11713 TaxID=3145233 RepID=UPI00374EF27C